MNILITSAGQRVSLVKSFKDELSKLNLNGKVYTADLNPLMAPACHISDASFKVSRVTKPEYIDELIGICLKYSIKLLVPTIDTELIFLSKFKTQFDELGIEILVSDQELIELCRDKRKTNEFFNAHGVEVPVQYCKEDLKFPLFIKPYDGSLSKGIYCLRSHQDLLPEHLNNPKNMYMEYISPEHYKEYTVDCYYDKTSYLKCVVPRERIFVRAGEVNKAKTCKNIIVDTIFNCFSYIKGARGCITMQFFLSLDSTRLLGIEINPRFGGGYPLTYLSGANYSRWIIEEYLLGKHISEYNAWEDQLIMLRYDAEVLVRA